MEKVTGGAAVGSGLTTIALAWLEANAIGIGAFCTLVTTGVYVYIAISRNRRERSRHGLKMEELKHKVYDSLNSDDKE